MNKTPRQDTPRTLNVKDLHDKIDGIGDHDRKTFAAACWYADNGIMIIPFLGGGMGFPPGMDQHHATRSPKKIDDWWDPDTGRYPGARIAMAQGGQAGVCAIDLDAKGDNSGMASLAEASLMYGNYDDPEGDELATLMASTPSGGRHMVFSFHPEVFNRARVAMPCVDTRGGAKKDPLANGGILFVEPSKSIKPGVEGTYRWDENATEIKEMPQWLVDVLNNRAVEKPKGGLQLQESYIQSADGLHGDGRDKNIYGDLMRFAGIGYNEEQLYALVPDILSRMDPPDEDMVVKKVKSVLASSAYAKVQAELRETGEIKSNKPAPEPRYKTTGSIQLEVNNRDQPLRSDKNLRAILNSPVFHQGYGLIEYDDFNQQFVRNNVSMNRVSDWASGIRAWIVDNCGLEYALNTIRETATFVADAEREHVNVARKYMLGCPAPAVKGEADFWGSGRAGPGPNFERLCDEVLSLNDRALHLNYTEEVRNAYKAFLWFWLRGVVARACVPGCKMEIVLNIFGGQGIGKSLFFRALCPNPSWFTDSIGDGIAGGNANNRDELMKLHAKIIVEMPELSPIKIGGKSGDNKMKQFISVQTDRFRRPYGTDTIELHRTCALCGTSNETDVYRDLTGTRRYASINHGDIPINVGDRNKGVMKEIRDKMWGEVVASFAEGELDAENRDELVVTIPPQLRSTQSGINSTHKYEEVGVTEVADWMSDKTRVSWREIISFAKTVPGLTDAKESVIMNQVKKELMHRKVYEFKDRAHHNQDGVKVDRGRVWVNTSLGVEKEHKAGMPVPPHWSTYTSDEKADY